MPCVVFICLNTSECSNLHIIIQFICFFNSSQNILNFLFSCQK